MIFSKGSSEARASCDVEKTREADDRQDQKGEGQMLLLSLNHQGLSGACRVVFLMTGRQGKWLLVGVLTRMTLAKDARARSSTDWDRYRPRLAWKQVTRGRCEILKEGKEGAVRRS